MATRDPFSVADWGWQGSQSYHHDRYGVQFKSLRLDTPGSYGRFGSRTEGNRREPVSPTTSKRTARARRAPPPETKGENVIKQLETGQAPAQDAGRCQPAQAAVRTSFIEG